MRGGQTPKPATILQEPPRAVLDTAHVGDIQGALGVIRSVLLLLSAILTVTTLFPEVNVATLTVVLGALLVVGLGTLAVLVWRRHAPAPDQAAGRRARETWTMPPLALLDPPAWSPVNRVALVSLRGYLVIAVLLLLVKSIQLAVSR